MVARSKKKKSVNPNDRRNIWLLVLTTLLILGSIFMFMPPQEKINQGLDIQGGLSVILTAKGTDGAEVSTDDLEKSRCIIESRVNALGASESTVQLQGTDQILVQIPGLSDTEEALNTIGKTGKLEFARLDSFTDESVKTSIEKGQISTQETYTDELGNSFPAGEATNLTVEEGTYTPLISGKNITKVSVGQAQKLSAQYAVNITLDSEGTQAFAEATAELKPTNGKIVIILDGEVQSAPGVDSVITGGEVQITGNYTLEEAQSLQTVLESGSLPVSFEYAQSQVVGPTLGQDALFSGVMVAVIGLLIVMLYLLFFYRGLGIITASAMAIFAAFYLGILATLSALGLFSLSLAGIAGIVLTIGMAADSSILTIERFREEIRMGRSVRAASITGVRHAIVTSIDADLVTLVSALSLFFLATASVKGFGLTLAIGIICDIIMMLAFKAPLIRLLAPRSIQKHPGFWGIQKSLAVAEGDAADATRATDAASAREVEQSKASLASKASATATDEANEVPSQSSAEKKVKPTRKLFKRDINFLGHRKVFLAVAALLIVASGAVVGVKGMNFGIEFVGGTSVAFHGTGDISLEEMRVAFEEAGEPDAVIQTTTTDGENGFLIRTTTTSAEDATAYANQVASGLGLQTESFEVTTIGPDWGATVIQSSVIAFLVSIILIIIYIAIRFEYKMGITAIIALLHDLIIVMGIYALVGREVNPNTIAALLTILGYSLYDSVVVFHRINDNMKEAEIKCTFMTMANHSINQVLIRTLNTSLTSLIPVLAMLFFGGETLKDFAFAMSIGLICGAYSSIAVACPLYAMWKTREPKYAKLVKKYGPQVELFEFGGANMTSTVKALKSSDTRATNEETRAANEDTRAVNEEENVPTQEGKVSASASPKSSKQSPGKQQSNHRYKRKKK